MSGVSSPTLGRIALRLIRPWRCPLRTTPKAGHRRPSPLAFGRLH